MADQEDRANAPLPAWLADEDEQYIALVLAAAATPEPSVAFDDHPVGTCAWCDAIRLRRDRGEDV